MLRVGVWPVTQTRGHPVDLGMVTLDQAVGAIDEVDHLHPLLRVLMPSACPAALSTLTRVLVVGDSPKWPARRCRRSQAAASIRSQGVGLPFLSTRLAVRSFRRVRTN